MHPPRTRSSRALHCVAWIAFAFISPARAGDVPPTALSQVTGMDPILLDYSSLLFQFPQAVVARDSIPFSLGVAPQGSSVFGYVLDVEVGLGASVQLGRMGFFALSQRAMDPSYSNVRSTLMQFGTGVRVGPLQLGAAVRGLRQKYQTEYLQERPPYTYGGANEDIHDLIEPAFGIGVVAGGVCIDGVLELGFESYQIGNLRVDQDTLATQLLADTSAQPSGALRFSVPLGDWGRLTTAGQYGQANIDWQGLSFDNRLRGLEFHEKREAWLASSALVFSTWLAQRVAIGGHYSRQIEPYFEASGSGATERHLLDARNASASLAIAREITTRFWGHAAVALTYQETIATTKASSGQGSYQEVVAREYFEDRFSWGAAYSRREFDAVASVSTSLRLYDPIVALDAHLHF